MKNDKTIFIHCSGHIDAVRIEDILRVEAYQNYTKIFLKSSIMLVSMHSLRQLKNQLGDLFFQSHKSHLVNMNYVNRFYKNGSLELCSEICVPLSRRRKDEFLQIWEQNYCINNNTDSLSQESVKKGNSIS